MRSHLAGAHADRPPQFGVVQQCSTPAPAAANGRDVTMDDVTMDDDVDDDDDDEEGEEDDVGARYAGHETGVCVCVYPLLLPALSTHHTRPP